MTNCSPEWQKGNELTSQLARGIVKSNHPWVRDLTNRHHGHPLRIWYQWIIWRTTFSVYFVRGLLCVCVYACVCTPQGQSFGFFPEDFLCRSADLVCFAYQDIPSFNIFSQHFSIQSTNGRKGKFLILCKHLRFPQEIGHECSEPSLPRIKTWRCPHCDSLRRSMI